MNEIISPGQKFGNLLSLLGELIIMDYAAFFGNGDCDKTMLF